MKDFLKMVLAVVTGLIVMSVIGLILSMGLIGGMALAGGSKTVLPKNMVLEMDMSALVVSEQSSPSSPLAMLSSGMDVENIGIWDAVQAINAAAEDPAVSFIYIRSDGSSTGLANVQELRKALANFRETSGKAVVSYIEAPTTGSYYLSSVSDKIYMTSHPGAGSMITGVGSRMIFLGDLLKKFGVNVQLIRHGKYKSAGEMYTRSNSSPENREQYQRLVDSMWETMSAEIANDRRMDVGELNAAIDNLSLCLPEDFLARGFVDELLTRDELQEKIAALAGVESYRDVRKVGLKEYAENRTVKPVKATQEIAIVYAEGNIIDGTDLNGVAGDRFASILSKIRANDRVKAVVLRVNSPGGSVIASDKIKHEIDLLCEDRTVIASYGEYAASGGYWISNGCDRIFSNAGTLTGSIGVFGTVPDFSKTLKDVAHVGIENVNSNRHSDMYSMTRPFDKDEYNYMLRSIEDIYDRFTSIVADGRGMTREAVDEIGQGRVWTGADAIRIGLVDEIGTLEDAVRYAAEAAGDADLANWKIGTYPRPMDELTMIMNALSKNRNSEEDLVRAAMERLGNAGIVARMPYDITIR